MLLSADFVVESQSEPAAACVLSLQKLLAARRGGARRGLTAVAAATARAAEIASRDHDATKTTTSSILV